VQLRVRRRVPRHLSTPHTEGSIHHGVLPTTCFSSRCSCGCDAGSRVTCPHPNLPLNSSVHRHTTQFTFTHLNSPPHSSIGGSIGGLLELVGTETDTGDAHSSERRLRYNADGGRPSVKRQKEVNREQHEDGPVSNDKRR
jgi:hypothetical protein